MQVCDISIDRLMSSANLNVLAASFHNSFCQDFNYKHLNARYLLNGVVQKFPVISKIGRGYSNLNK